MGLRERVGFAPRTRRLLTTALHIAVSVTLLVIVVTRVGLEPALDHISRIEPWILVVAMGATVASVGISAWKWQYLLTIKRREYSLGLLWTYYYIGKFFNAFLPTAIGGDAARMYYLHADQDEGVESVSSVVMGRLTGLVSMFLVAGSASLIAPGVVPPQVRIGVVGICGTGLLCVGLLFTERSRSLFGRIVSPIEFLDVGAKLTVLFDSIRDYRSEATKLLAVVGISIVYRLVLVGINLVVAMGLGMNVPWLYFLVVVPVTELLLMIPISIQGFGVRETTYVALFSAAGASASLALALGFIMQLTLVGNNLLGGMVYLGYRFRNLRMASS